MRIGFAVAAVLFLAGCGGGGGNNRGILSFTSLSYGVNENGTPLNAITVQRLGGEGAVGATIVIESGTASADIDFVSASITVAWNEGDTSPIVVTIPILEDHDDEPDETLTLRLTNPTGGATIRDPLGDTTLNIIDNDVAGTIQFALSSYIYLENGTAFGPEITVTRSGGADGIVTATVVATDGTATGDPSSPVEPFDYTPFSTLVTFLDQDTTPVLVSLAGVIRQDLLPEPAEEFHVGIVNPTGGATIGFTSPAAVTIADDDFVLAIPNPAPGSEFGAAIVKLGSKLLVGAPGNAAASGRVYVFDPADGSLVDTISRPSSNQLGSVLAAGGATLAIGSPGTVWALHAATLLDRFVLTSSLPGFGASALVPGDGRLLVGAPLAPPPGGGSGQAGAALVYDAVTGAPLQTIDGSGDGQLGSAFARFGASLLVGAPGAPGAVFEYAGDPLALVTTLDDLAPQTPPAAFGRAIVASEVAMGVYVGAPDADVGGQVDAGRVELFSSAGNVTAFQGIAGAHFGASLMISTDFLYVGAPDEGPGRVHVYDFGLNQVTTFDSPNPSPASRFGAATCDFDGSVVIAAPQDSAGGTVYILKLF